MKELRSFLGMFNQLRTFIPDVTQSTDTLRKLLKRDTPYNWDESMNNEFLKIKEILQAPMTLQAFKKEWKTTDYSSK